MRLASSSLGVTTTFITKRSPDAALADAEQLTSLRRLHISSYAIDNDDLVKALVAASSLTLDLLLGTDFSSEQRAMLKKAPHLEETRIGY
jgi:hypothetical protein